MLSTSEEMFRLSDGCSLAAIMCGDAIPTPLGTLEVKATCASTLPTAACSLPTLSSIMSILDCMPSMKLCIVATLDSNGLLSSSPTTLIRSGVFLFMLRNWLGVESLRVAWIACKAV